MPYVRPIHITVLAIFLLIVLSFLMFEQSLVNVFNEITTFLGNQPLPLFWISLLIVFVLITDILLPVPSSLVAVLAGTFLGFASGAAVIWMGLTGGSILGYALGTCFVNLLGNNSPLKRDIQRASLISKNLSGTTIALLRGIPVMAETSVIAAGLIRYPFKKFLILTSLANTGIALVYAFVGSQVQGEASIILIVGASIALPSLAFAFKFSFERLFKHTRTNNLKPNKALTNLAQEKTLHK